MNEANNISRDKKRKKAWHFLGGQCVYCGGKEPPFHCDHINPKTKSFTIASNWGRSWEETKEELKKCQLLCPECHLLKTKENNDNTGGGHNKWTKIIHGRVTAYNVYGCRCDACKKAKRISRTSKSRRSIPSL